MHMADALLSPAVGATFWAGTLAAIGLASRNLKKNIDDKVIPLMGVMGAFIFASQMINFTIPGTGSSGHIGGGMILAIILGPAAAFLAIASVLTVQGLFFADGGLLALGCNIWNMGIYPCFIVYPLVYKPLAGDSRSSVRILAVSVLSTVLALQLGALSVVLETTLSGKSELPFRTFILLMQPIHLAIGIVEGFITAAVINYVRTAQPEIIGTSAASRPLGPEVSVKKLVIAFFVFAVITGGFLSWFASSHPDGLEWAIQKITNSREPAGREPGTAQVLKDIQGKTTVFPGYGFKPGTDVPAQHKQVPAWPGIDAGKSLAGVFGAIVVLGVIILIGIGIRMIRRRQV
jgi:cobalt/nickel transport system permease protein